MALASDCQRSYLSKRFWKAPSGPLGLTNQRAVVFCAVLRWLYTTPEFQRTQPTTWEADQAAWRAALERFVEGRRRLDKVDARGLVWV
jgi:hypothetical protein